MSNVKIMDENYGHIEGEIFDFKVSSREIIICSTCHGYGHIIDHSTYRPSAYETEMIQTKKVCSRCNGSGKMVVDRTISYTPYIEEEHGLKVR